MENTRLIKLLKSLDGEEISGFGEFVNCAYFNKDKDCTRLWEILKTNYLGRRINSELTREELFFKLYPEKKKINSTLGVKLTALTRLVERFLSIRQLEARPVLGQHLLLKSFLEKDVKTHFQSSFTRGQVLNTLGDLGDAEAYYYRYLFEKSYYVFVAVNIKQLNKLNPFEMINAFEIYTIATKLYLWSTLINFQHLLRREYDFSVFEYMETYLKKSPFMEVPLIKILYIALCATREPEDTQHFDNLKKYLMDMNDVLSNKVKTQLYRIIGNYCTRKINQGKNEYLREAFVNYQTMLKYDVLTDSKYIPTSTFKNCVSLGCRLKEFEWVEEFIEKNRNKLNPEFRDSVCHYNQGQLYFHKKDYKMALHHLIRMDTIYVDYNTDARLLLIKSYYELDNDYSERSEQIFRSFMEYIRQSKVYKTQHKKMYINFTKVLISLYRIKHRFGNRSIDVIRERIDKYELITNKKWLLEKIEELK